MAKTISGRRKRWWRHVCGSRIIIDFEANHSNNISLKFHVLVWIVEVLHSLRRYPCSPSSGRRTRTTLEHSLAMMTWTEWGALFFLQKRISGRAHGCTFFSATRDVASVLVEFHSLTMVDHRSQEPRLEAFLLAASTVGFAPPMYLTFISSILHY